MKYLPLILVATACAVHPTARIVYQDMAPKLEVVISRDSEDRSQEDAVEKPFDAVLFRKAFKSYLTSQNDCPEDPGELDEAFDAGYFVPRINTVLNGSFSRPGARQQLYVIAVGECGATHSDHWGTKRLLLVENGEILFNQKYFWDSAEHPVDLDNDGIQEVTATSVFCNQGGCSEEAAIVKVTSSDFQAVLDLGSIFENNCGVPNTFVKTEKWAQVTVENGHLHKLWQEKKCR